MSRQPMSINKMLLTNQDDLKERKVKVFYTFYGSQKHCLCSFDMTLNEADAQGDWLAVPLCQCLAAVCSSCPDQLTHKDAAVYSANFEESATVENWSPLHDAQSNIVWEGHGLLSSLLYDQQLFVTGKRVESTIEVLIQLQPVQASPPSDLHPLPSMRSLLDYEPKHSHLAESRPPPWSCESSTLKKIKPNPVTIRCITSTGTTDTFFHQSRRKKRDTKPPNAADVRLFIQVEKSGEGHYLLPAEVDSWTVLDLGTVVWDRAAFHNQRYIYPVGYRVKKWYRSMIDPHSDTQYTCEILDGGEEPIFQLNADDNPTECWRGPTPTTVWTIVVRRAFAIRNMDYGHNPVGPDFFGLRKNTIAKMIQDLPNADKCKNYIWQNFEALSHAKGKAVRRSSTRIHTLKAMQETNHHTPSSTPSSPDLD
ncbi:F/Y-rich N-terminus-domain-containing protein [Sporodiniella umbellata]|nr:F/Y-rich N-terminus-domain-containing protein [Sporodiniella umbellata]